MERDRIIGEVIGPNSVRASGRIFQCWINAKSAATPQPLDLAGYRGKVVEVSGRLNEELWEARFVGVVHGESYQETEGKANGAVTCYTYGSMGYGMGW